MTNKEYIEKYNLSFSEVTKMWDNQTNHIEDWLNQEHQEHRFKVGDFVTAKCDDNGIGVVVDVKDYVYLKWLRRDGTFAKWEYLYVSNRKYYCNDHEVFYMYNENNYEKIF